MDREIVQKRLFSTKKKNSDFFPKLQSITDLKEQSVTVDKDFDKRCTIYRFVSTEPKKLLETNFQKQGSRHGEEI